MRYIVFENAADPDRYELLLYRMMVCKAVRGIVWSGDKRIVCLRPDLQGLAGVRYQASAFLETYPDCIAKEVISHPEGRLHYYYEAKKGESI